MIKINLIFRGLKLDESTNVSLTNSWVNNLFVRHKELHEIVNRRTIFGPNEDPKGPGLVERV